MIYLDNDDLTLARRGLPVQKEPETAEVAFWHGLTAAQTAGLPSPPLNLFHCLFVCVQITMLLVLGTHSLPPTSNCFGPHWIVDMANVVEEDALPMEQDETEEAGTGTASPGSKRKGVQAFAPI